MTSLRLRLPRTLPCTAMRIPICPPSVKKTAPITKAAALPKPMNSRTCCRWAGLNASAHSEADSIVAFCVARQYHSDASGVGGTM